MRGGEGVHTSSSITLIRDWRYSSMVRWKASRSLRFTGTVRYVGVSLIG